MTDNNNNAEEGVESGVSEDAFEQDPVLTNYQTEEEQQVWMRALAASRKERQRFDSIATKALKRYRDERSSAYEGARFYNIYFANTELKMGALYAQIPKPSVKRRYSDADDDVSRVASLILERNIRYEIEKGNFDSTIKQILFDRIVPGLGVGWMRFDQEEETVFQPQPPVIDPLTGMLQEMPPEPVTRIIDQEACIDYVAWNDFFWAPCKVWTLCSWVARRISMTAEAVKARFGDRVDATVLKELSFSTEPNSPSNVETLHPQNQTEATVDVYEIWDKERRLIFWVCEDAPIPLDVQEDTNGFDGFFPTPMNPLGRFDTANTQPISDYQLVRGKYEELDELNIRCSALQKAMGVRFVYDSGSPELAALYTNTEENHGVAVKNWASFLGEKGGLSGSMQFAPLKEISEAFVGASTQLDRIKNQIYEVEGINDFVRGAATPYETATATNVKSSQSFGRFAVQQAEIARYIESLLRMKAHLICRFYTPETILKRAGAIQQADQQLIPAALQLLKDEQLTGFRVSVSVDSLQLPNWNTEKSERTELVRAVTNFMAEAMQGVRQMPEIAPVAMQILKFAVAGYKGSNEIEGVIDQGLQQMLRAQSQQAGQERAPTPEQVKAQATQQKAQTDLQIAAMQEQTKLQLAQMHAQIEAMKAKAKMDEAAYQQAMRERDQQMRQFELMLKAQDQQATHAHNAALGVISAGRPAPGGF